MDLGFGSGLNPPLGPSMDPYKSDTSGYHTAESQGADYTTWGKIKNWFTGQNDLAESKANNYNTALSEEKERYYNSLEAETARNFASTEAQKDRDWQKMMSDTKYQRMIADAKAAGINPLYLIGSTSSTPGGSTATTTSASSTGSRPSDKKGTKSDLLNKTSSLAITALTLAKLLAMVG